MPVRPVSASIPKTLPRWFLPVLCVLFFLSGLSALVYQVLWLRLLSLVFGVTVYAASTVLSSFMGGLAVGSVLAGRLADRARHPLRLFGLTEMAIGVVALATPLALGAVHGLYVSIARATPDALAALTLARFICSFGVLFVPTVLMGATLPFVLSSSLIRGGPLGHRVGVLYGANTCGALVGAALAGFYLIGAHGIRASFVLAATINVVVGLVAVVLSFSRGLASFPPTVSAGSGVTAIRPEHTGVAAPHRALRDRRVVLVVLGLSGLAALALEVVWFRLLVLYLPATTYAFTTMLATVLGGIAAGSALAAPWLKRSRDWLTTLAWLELLTGVLVVLAAAALAWSYQAGWATSDVIRASLITILPATLPMGMAFPVGARLWAGDEHGGAGDAPAERLGLLYGVNLVGAILGALVGGFVLLPALGTRAGLIACAGIYIAAGGLLLMQRPRPRVVAAGAVAVALFAVTASMLPDPFSSVIRRRYGPTERLFWHHEGVQTTVTVNARPFGGMTLYLDGLHQANDTPDMVRLHRLIGHLPMLLHPAPREALVVGLGGGATAGAVSQHPGVRVDIVELSLGVQQAARLFSHVNYDVLRQPNVRLRVDDGRNYLALTDRRYDVITADIIQPIHAGAGHLYSVEYFRLSRQALREDGVMLQWIGHRSVTQYKLIMRTFLAAFPHATVWADGSLLAGTKRPLAVSREGMERQFQSARTSTALGAIDLSPERVLALYTCGPDRARAFVGDGALLTDDRPLVEYHRSLPADDPVVDVTPLRDPDARVPLVDPVTDRITRNTPIAR